MVAAGTVRLLGLVGLWLSWASAVDPMPRLSAVRISQNGPSDKADSFQVQPCTVSKAEVASALSLPLRDLRLIDAHANLAAISARRGAMILSLVNVRAVVQPRQVIVLATSEGDLERLVTRVMAHLTLTVPDSEDAPFDQRVLEACIQHATCAVRNHLASLKEEIFGILTCLRTVPSQSGLSLLLQTLLPLKNELDKLTAAAQELLRAINEALSSDDDLDAMQLTQLERLGSLPLPPRRRRPRFSRARQLHHLLTTKKMVSGNAASAARLVRPRRAEAYDEDDEEEATAPRRGGRGGRRSEAAEAEAEIEVDAEADAQADAGEEDDEEDEDAQFDIDHSGTEMLLEAYLTQLESLTTEAGDVEATIKNTEETVDLQLDLLRNRILRFELRLSLATLVLGVGCFVTGMFGMNLTSHIEEQRHMFWLVSFLLIFGMGAGWGAFVEFSKREGLLR